MTMRRWWVLAAVVVGVGACAPPGGQAAPIAAPMAEPVTTVLVVRHAEKAPEPAADPVLSAQGMARAEALLPIAREHGVDAAVVTHLQRTRLTAQPALAALGITPLVVRAAGPTHPQDVARAVLGNYRGRTVLVVGHSNTVAEIVAALGGGTYPQLCDAQYDQLFIVRVPAAGAAQTTRRTFGVATPVEAGCTSM